MSSDKTPEPAQQVLAVPARVEPLTGQREAFELYAQELGYSIQPDTRLFREGGYWSSHTHLMWEAWKAAQAAQPAPTAAPAEPLTVSDFQLELLFDAAQEHGEFGRGFREHARHILAATPPARLHAPLSDEQIASLVRDFYAGRAARDNTPEAIVRAVERAHGIGITTAAAPKERA